MSREYWKTKLIVLRKNRKREILLFKIINYPDKTLWNFMKIKLGRFMTELKLKYKNLTKLGKRKKNNWVNSKRFKCKWSKDIPNLRWLTIKWNQNLTRCWEKSVQKKETILSKWNPQFTEKESKMALGFNEKLEIDKYFNTEFWFI